MTQFKTALVLFLGVTMLATGCAKKTDDTASLTSLESTEELAQLPQANSTATQQTGVEILPIETSPVTQQVASAQASVSQAISSLPSNVESAVNAASSSGSMSRDREIQTALKNAGLYSGNIDGKIGPATRKAITTFQTNHGLKADGKVGPKTWAALEPFLSQAAATETSASNQ